MDRWIDWNLWHLIKRVNECPRDRVRETMPRKRLGYQITQAYLLIRIPCNMDVLEVN